MSSRREQLLEAAVTLLADGGAPQLTHRGPDAVHRSRWLLAYIDGLIGDQLARPQPDFDPAAALAPGVHGICTAPAPASGTRRRHEP